MSKDLGNVREAGSGHKSYCNLPGFINRQRGTELVADGFELRREGIHLRELRGGKAL